MANEPVPGRESLTQNKSTIDPSKISQDISNEPKTEAPIVEVKQDVIPKFFEEEKPNEISQEAQPVQEEADSELEEIVNPGADHFKKLRKSQAELKKSLADKTKESEELTSKLKLYETGEIVPEVLAKKDEEIVRLSKFEKLVNLKGSKEYQEKYVDPIEQTKQKLKEIFADYGVPPERLDSVVNRAINTKKRPDLNQFLIEHLGNDELGASEAKTHVFKAWELQNKASEAENEPANALATMQQESQAVAQVREGERRARIVKVAESTWVDTLKDIRTEGKLLELIHRDDDPEFNANFPDRLLPQAAKEYGRMVTELGKQGITDIPKELAKAIAKMVLLAHASGVAVETRNRAMDQVDTLSSNLTRYHTQLRPQIGGGTSRGERPQGQKPLTPEQEAANITNSILTRR